MSTIVLSPRGSTGLPAELARLVRYRDLLLLLVQKDLKAKYKGTALGFLWTFLNPLLLMILYAVVFSVVARVSLHRYPVFLLCGCFHGTPSLSPSRLRARPSWVMQTGAGAPISRASSFRSPRPSPAL